MLKKFLSIILVIISLFFVACGYYKTGGGCGWRPKTYTTNYTNEEHVERIKERAWNIVERRGVVYDAEVDGERVGDNKVVDIQVYILYSFDDRPEYFYIIYEYEEKIYIPSSRYENVLTKFSHQFGYIENDEYRMFYSYDNMVHNLGKGFWGENDLLDVKKYYCHNETYYGYKDINGQLVIFKGKRLTNSYELEKYIKSDVAYQEIIDLTNLECRRSSDWPFE